MLYARANLGDDLFLQILLERYSNVQFYINIDKEFSHIVKNHKNVTIVEKQPETFENRKPEEYDGYIYIGGMCLYISFPAGNAKDLGQS